jgi:hypothetical protein
MEIKDALGKSIFLLGAGASYGTGCKMSQEMLDALKGEIIKDDSAVFNRPQKEALKFLLSCLEYHNTWRSYETNNKFVFTPNIEELALLIRRIKNRENFLPYPVTGNWADKLITLESEFNNQKSNEESLFESLDRIIKQELLPEWLLFDKNRLLFLNPLKELFENLAEENFEMEIFTLNNDLVIETFFETHNMKPKRGFNNNDWRGINYQDVELPFDKINLYKLHGSLDWVRLESGEVKEKEKCNDDELDMIDKKHNPYVIFGHGTKTFSVDPFFSLIHSFRKLLVEREYIFVVGYSFFDPYINNMLIEAVNIGNKKVIIVNPKFGPKIDYNENNLDAIDEALDVNGNKVGKMLVEYIEAIQSNPFYSEMPEFNINRINGEDVISYYKIGFDEFLSFFFANKGIEFISLIKKFDKEKENNNPF